ncbi:MAG TPA: hypothetical protein VGZ27_19265 [Vicinamibacterales bacterium]|jgi:hypothetical protein|nr:hypothetical protein [Vicinamibacterales bacterium]
MSQTWWLSFCGEHFLGVAVVDVTEDEALEMVEFVVDRRRENGLPCDPADLNAADEGATACWLAAVIRKAHATGCNPGGQVAGQRIDELPLFANFGHLYPRGKLLSKADVQEIDALIEAKPQ